MATIDSVRALSSAQGRPRNNLISYFTAPKLHRVGSGLYLSVEVSARDGRLLKTWKHRYSHASKPRTDSLGSAYEVTLEEACAKIDTANEALAKGFDPRGERQASHAKVTLATFRQCAEAFMVAKFGADILTDPTSFGKNPLQWKATIEETYPILGGLAPDQVTTSHVYEALAPMLQRAPTTGQRTRARLEDIIEWAISNKARTNEVNPATHKKIRPLMMGSAKRTVKKNFAAVPWTEVPAFVLGLGNDDDLGATALKFAIRTAKRTSEVLLAQWTEFDLDAGIWAIPAERMKMRRDHRVPLAEQTLALLRPLRELRLRSPFVFPGRKPGQPLSTMVMLMRLRRLGYGPNGEKGPATVHGFRSCFKDWGRKTKQDRELVELCLAHLFGDETERAYTRDDMLEERRAVLKVWNDFIDGASGATVIPISAGARQSA